MLFIKFVFQGIDVKVFCSELFKTKSLRALIGIIDKLAPGYIN